MCRLTILIPCLGPVEACEDTLVSALQHRPADSEIVVVHTQPYADPYDLRREVRFLVVSGEPDLCTLINSGLEVATGDVVHLLSPELVVSEGWTDAALRWFEATAIGAVSPWLIAPSGKVTAAGVSYVAGGARKVIGGDACVVDARHHSVIGPTLRGAFYRRAALVALGGMPLEVGDLADVDIALSLRRSGWKMAIEPCCRLVDHRTADPSPQGWKFGLNAERLYFRQAQNCERVYGMITHPLVVALDVLKQFPYPSMVTQFFGRLAAWLEKSSHAKRELQIEASKKQFAAMQEQSSRIQPKELTRRKPAIPTMETGVAERRRAA